MATPGCCQKEQYVAATRKLVAIMTKIVDNAKKGFDQQLGGESKLLPVSMMATKEMCKMADPLWTGCYEWMKAIGVRTRREAGELQKGFSDDEDVLQCMSELQALEAQFTEMMSRMHAMVQKEEDKVRSYILCASLRDMTLCGMLPESLHCMVAIHAELRAKLFILLHTKYTTSFCC